LCSGPILILHHSDSGVICLSPLGFGRIGERVTKAMDALLASGAVPEPTDVEFGVLGGGARLVSIPMVFVPWSPDERSEGGVYMLPERWARASNKKKR
jgi:hypothetical protein